MKKNSEKRPEKENEYEVLERVKKAVCDQSYQLSEHAAKRMLEREIDLLDIENVLAKGRRDKKHDEYKEEYKKWTYAFKGNDFDKARNIRVAVCFARNVLVVTVIDLDKKE